jgi:hypothetical protein
MTFTESTIEQAAIDWLQELGYEYAFGPDLAFDGPAPERENYEDVILLNRLRDAIGRLNLNIPAQAQHTLTLPETTAIEFNVDGLPPVPVSEVEQACAEVVELVQRFCGGRARVEVLSEGNPSISLED